jgi:hypothetical protein
VDAVDAAGTADAAEANRICAPTIKGRRRRWASACARTTPESEHSSVMASAV